MKSKRTFLGILMGAWLLAAVPVLAQKPAKASNDKERCHATTQKGERCKLKVVDGSKYCATHNTKNPNSAKCKATTKAGTRCTRAAVKSGYCKQHYEMKKTGKK